jgi:hypothetical protein
MRVYLRPSAQSGGVGVGSGVLCGGVAGRIIEVGRAAPRVTKVANRFFGVPEFHYYALADGLRVLLSRLGMKCAWCRPSSPPDSTAQFRLFNTS